jgi:hypothetical protein
MGRVAAKDASKKEKDEQEQHEVQGASRAKSHERSRRGAIIQSW